MNHCLESQDKKTIIYTNEDYSKVYITTDDPEKTKSFIEALKKFNRTVQIIETESYEQT
jgi:RNase P/RNase MRP subunit p30